LYGKFNSVKFLIEKGANINAKNNLNQNVLFKSVYCGNLDMLKFLIEMGADINAKNIDGNTILIWAS
jgi:ankyrin repeat protein